MIKFYIDDYNLLGIESDEPLREEDIHIFEKTAEHQFRLFGGSISLRYTISSLDDVTIIYRSQRYEAIPRFVTHTHRFEKDHPFEIAKLGSFYHKDRTDFSCYAPTHLHLYLVLEGQKYEMNRKGSTYSLSIEGDLEGKRYHYEDPFGKSFTDPFSYNDTYNGKDSYILDLNKLVREPVEPKRRRNDLDLAIYETSVRDFSKDEAAGFENPGTFLAFCEKGLRLNGYTVGIDYLEELGISHLQLMPVFRFDRNDFEYNWGYNPVSYSSLHAEYGVGRGPYDLVYEFQKMVDTLHETGIRVILDVVFNHVFNDQKNCLGRMIPYFFFRYHADGKLGNGSYCGNEFRTESEFAKAYLNEMCRRYITVLDIDGLRFDLMGLMDVSCVNTLKYTCRYMKKDFLLYGEGWNMGEVLPESFRCHIQNADKIPGVAFFNPEFRDCMRGSTSDGHLRGYLEDNHSKRNSVMKVLSGSYEYGLSPTQSINYIECHDNYTLYDKFRVTNPYLEKDILIEKSRMALGLVALASGIPFFHSGQEFLRSKKMIDNSYNRSDEINKIDWTRRVKYHELAESLKDLLALRHKHDVFTKKDPKTSFIDYYEVLIFCLGDYRVFINPCIFDHVYQDGSEYELLYNGKKACDLTDKVIGVPKYSVVVAKKID